MPSIKKNFFWSSILTVSGYLFPLITYPYVTRVLGVEKIGICSFVDSIINYGILFSMMGMGTLAIREIAQIKNDKIKLSSTFSSFVVLNILTSLIAIAILFILTLSVSKLQNYQQLLFIGSSKILFNALLVEWLYKGLEDFKYITVRSLIIKVLYVISIFIFVRCESDYVIYFIIHVLIIVINSLINITYSRKFLKFTLKDLHIAKYLQPFFILGVYQVLTSMYTSFNVTYLGFKCDNVEVGFYSTAVKLYSMILAFFTAFTGVMMPRQSSLLAEGKIDEFKRLTGKSVDLLFLFVIPLVIIGVVYADSIIYIIAGKGYEGAVLPMRIIMPLLLIIGYEQILVIQMLVPMKKDKAILANSIIGAIVGLSLNIVLVPIFKSVGSAIVWFLSELIVLILSQYFVSKYVSFKFPWRKIFIRLLWCIPILTTCIIFKNHFSNSILVFVCGASMVCFYYVIIESLFYHNEYLYNALNKAYSYFHRNNDN